MCKSLAYIQ